MHELSVAATMVDLAAEEAARLGAVRIHALHLRLGRLSGIVKEALIFSWDAACQGTALEGANLVIEDIPAAIYCGGCETERELQSIQHFVCAVCGASSVEIVRGGELEIAALEIE
ncbi:MAG: hydrogenase maturation nickel metallochaperone HypA [Blastocatellales bacterium]|nr:hydrogenase maturation nickel metallochaperone HypA [Blastocatellales bacterium]